MVISLRANFLRGVACTPPKKERCNDAACQNERYSTEREKHSGRSLNENIFQQQLTPDQHQKQPKGASEITKPVDGSGQCEVERTQAEQRHNIAREYQERIARDGKNRRDGIQGKNQIGGLDHDQCQRKRREKQLRLSPHDKALTCEFRQDRKESSCPCSNRSEEHTSELQSPDHLVCRLLLEKKKKKI